ncbi:MAG: trehalose-6-phosphate synthase [Syntrophales bacterium]|jgi:trehalose 6-phosphate synthase|nr:trehalose-6-phosphate synthase [Syntrophales bacterium]MDY0045025.1 trehalose-6-phosphate synthase [Syntrophales bacterium]
MYKEEKEHSSSPESRLVIVSNRLPIVLVRDEDETLRTAPGSGGLVTALSPVLKDRGGLWIGWPGESDVTEQQVRDSLLTVSSMTGFDLKPVILTAPEVEGFYYGFANEILWPLLHDLLSRCNFEPSYWAAYCEVNRKFAREIAIQLEENDYVWIHDYQLVNVGKELRDLGVVQKIGFFLHTPFPQLDVFMKLPWRWEILQSLISYDLIGFQTLRDRRNFIQCGKALIQNARLEGKGQLVNLRANSHRTRVGAFPISIDYREFSEAAASAEVEEKCNEILGNYHGFKIILGVDRLDYTKGIPERLKAFQNALETYPELREKVVLVQLVVPSRKEISEYDYLKKEIERLTSEINGRFTQSGWVPVHYIFRTVERNELMAYYRAAEIGLVTPLKDGMNLIAKEFCACSIEENSVLILSEFAGAAAQMQKWSLLVNPFDQDRTADAIYEAFMMPDEEKKWRMKKLRASLRKNDIYQWVDSFLNAAISKRLDHFPVLEDYRPQIDVGVEMNLRPASRRTIS